MPMTRGHSTLHLWRNLTLGYLKTPKARKFHGWMCGRLEHTSRALLPDGYCLAKQPWGIAHATLGQMIPSFCWNPPQALLWTLKQPHGHVDCPWSESFSFFFPAIGLCIDHSGYLLLCLTSHSASVHLLILVRFLLLGYWWGSCYFHS